MDKKKLAILVTMKEDGRAEAGIESDDLTMDELEMMSFAAVSFIAESVIERMEYTESKQLYLTALRMRLTDLTESVKGE